TLLWLRILEMQETQPARIERQHDRLPVLVSIAGWTTGERFEEWFTERLATEYKVSEEVAQDLVRRRRVLPFLDGLDELDPPAIDESAPKNRSRAFLGALADWYDSAAPAPIVITCSTDQGTQLERALQGLRDTRQIQIRDLQPNQISAYVNCRLAGHQVL